MTETDMADYIQYDPRTGYVSLYCGNAWYAYKANQVPIGHGGMGDVLRGKNLQDGTAVAIKRVHDRFADIPEIRQRARVEAGYAFRHPHLVEMIGCCESVTGRGPVFIISKFVYGQTIDSFIKDVLRDLDHATLEKRVISMMLPVLDALEYIHSLNIVHMDIKPNNIMVERGRNVRLMDLGIAFTPRKNKMVDLNGNSSQSGLMGTPKYAAPEQFDAVNNTIDRRADIYQFGVTLYELLAGFNPFNANNLQEAVNKHKTNILPQFPCISDATLRVLRRAASPAREQRYANVTDLRNDLQAVLNAPDSEEGFFDRLRHRFRH